MGGGSGTPDELYPLQPIVVEWRDACTLHGWHSLEIGQTSTPMTVVERGYFVGIVDDHLITASRYANHPEIGVLVDEPTAIPMSEVVRISPRKETIRERLVRLRDNRTKGV